MNREIENLPLDRMLVVDAACDRFDEALLSSSGMSIEELLATVPHDLRTIVLREAIRMESETRSGRGENPSTQEYLVRFPELEKEIESLLPQTREIGIPNDASATLTLRADGDSSLSSSECSPHLNTRLLHLVPGNVFGRYRIERMLGRGGMGVVYLATDVRLNRQVALKFPRFADDPLLAQRFEREARTMASVSHRNLCSIFDVNEAEGIHYLTMAYIDGQTLAQLIKQSEPLSTEAIAKLLHKLSLATAFAHRAGVVHRDLKPANIMIDSEGEPVIMDFGLAIAREDDARLTHAGVFVGTPAYMAPEQTWDDDKAVGTWSDVYSLGAILYELLTGRNVFQGSASQVISQLVQGAVPQPPHTLRPQVDRRLESICLKAIAGRPEDRYESADAMAIALRDYMARPQALEELEEPASVKPLGKLEKARKYWVVSCGVSILVILGIWRPWDWQMKQGSKSAEMAAGNAERVQGDRTHSDKLDEATDPWISWKFGKSLKLDSGASVEIDGLHLDVLGAHTMEAFVTAGVPHDRRDKHVFGWPGPSSLFLRGPSSSWAFGLSHLDKYQFVEAPSPIQVAQRVHLALVRDGVAMKLFVDGKLADHTPEFQRELQTPKFPFKIGTANLPSTFVGLVDELRVSNVARYSVDFEPPREPMAPDELTLGLYHCDEGQDVTLVDSSGNNNHGRIKRGAWWQPGEELVFEQSRPGTNHLKSHSLPPPTKKLNLSKLAPDGYALDFDGKRSYVHIPTLTRNEAKPVTFEMWMKANTQPHECLVGVLSGQEYLQVNQDANKVLTFNRHMADLVPEDRQPILPGDWTHIATVADGDEVRLYINGKKVSARSKSTTSPAYSFDGAWLGAHPYREEMRFHYLGQLDEIRISNTARYRDDFQPDARFLLDDDTLALYHCDEADGDRLLDSSVHGHHGQLNEVKRHLHSSPWPHDLRTLIAPMTVEEVYGIQAEWSKYLNVPVTEQNSIDMRLQLVPPGTFLMGADTYDDEAQAHESPQHVVKITRPFQMSAHEVSVDLFRKFVESESYVTEAESDGMGGYDAQTRARTPDYVWSSRESANGELPVTNVSYADAIRFCEWLSKSEKRTYRLPTEAEWEYACRAGTQTRYYFGDQFDSAQANAATREFVGRVPCGRYPANPLGLFDMHGNVHEICFDSGRSYTLDSATDPIGDTGEGAEAVAVRGGAFGSNIVRLRSSNRYLTDRRKFPEVDFANISKGFRVVREISLP